MKIRNLLTLSLVFFFAVTLGSCVSHNKDGQWDDSIKLSSRRAEFSSDQGSTIINTEYTWWRIEDIKIGNTHFRQTNRFGEEYVLIDADWLTVERTDGNTLKLSVSENTSGSKRTATIVLQAGDYSDGITVNQSPASAAM